MLVTQQKITRQMMIGVHTQQRNPAILPITIPTTAPVETNEWKDHYNIIINNFWSFLIWYIEENCLTNNNTNIFGAIPLNEILVWC